MTPRLDVELVRRGLSRSRAAAQAAIAAGTVVVNEVVTTKPSTGIEETDRIAVSLVDRFVSRAAHKLLFALEDSGTAVAGRVLDAGASTGGFTQVCLEEGAERVYAVDVGHGQLAESLRHDPRVSVLERTNLRHLTLEHLDGEQVDLVVADVSFISLTLLVGPLLGVLRPDGTALLLVKPQFEVGRGGLDGHGIVRDEPARRAAVARVAEAAASLGWRTTWQGPSRVVGENGNQEYFVRLSRDHEQPDAENVGSAD